MPAFILLRYPGCRARIKAPPELLGQRRNCPVCNTPFVVRGQRPTDSGPLLAGDDPPVARPARY
jgi:hypothetical protein